MPVGNRKTVFIQILPPTPMEQGSVLTNLKPHIRRTEKKLCIAKAVTIVRLYEFRDKTVSKL